MTHNQIKLPYEPKRSASRFARMLFRSPLSAFVFLTFGLSMLAACSEKNVVRSYYPSGSIKTEAITKDAVLNGRAVMLSESGLKLSEAEYKGGALFGASASYFPDGKQQASASYEDGALHGASIAYHTNGQKAREANFHRGVLVGNVRQWSDTGVEVASTSK